MKSKESKSIHSKVITEITESIQDIDFGEVLIVVHDSKVVQIEKKVKKRFNN